MMAIAKVLVMIGLLVGTGSVFMAAAQDDESKAIKAEVFIKDRPARRSPNAAVYKPAARSSNNTNAAIPPAGTAFAQLGVTIWKFRRSTVADKTKELVEEDEGEPTEWTLQRVEESTPLAPGTKVRLSIESLSRDGYLYVIDREQYADGTLGDPLLIFPTKKTADANRVKAGRLIYVPSSTGKFRIMPSESGKRYVGEVITVLVASKPLIKEDQLGAKSIRLSSQQVESWAKQWGATATKFEMAGGAGQAMTEKEQAAGTDSSQVLTRDDPVPQTVYRVAIKPNDPVLVTVPLKLAKSH